MAKTGDRAGLTGEGMRMVPLFCTAVSGYVLLAMVVASLASTFDLLGTSRVGQAYPAPIYSLYPVAGTSPVRGAPGVAGADFSQVYTSGNALLHGESAYQPVTAAYKDRFGRPSGYPPLMNWFYLPLASLSYYSAFLIHTVWSLALFLGATLLLLRGTGLTRHFGRVAVVICSLYFLTPIGVTHLERGQFDLYPATAYVLCLCCVFFPRNQLLIAGMAGLVGALKWTTPPFLMCFSALGFLLSSGRRRLAFFLAPTVMTLVTLALWHELLEYWPTIQTYEINAAPYGLTLQYFLPRIWTKLVPVLITMFVLVLVLVRDRSVEHRAKMLRAVSGPFSLALINVSICFGTLSYEYHTVALLGVLPGLVVWAERVHWLTYRLRAVTLALFGSFLVVAFRTFGWTNAFDPVAMSRVYAFFAVLFLGISAYITISPREHHFTLLPS